MRLSSKSCSVGYHAVLLNQAGRTEAVNVGTRYRSRDIGSCQPVLKCAHDSQAISQRIKSHQPYRVVIC